MPKRKLTEAEKEAFKAKIQASRAKNKAEKSNSEQPKTATMEFRESNTETNPLVKREAHEIREENIEVRERVEETQKTSDEIAELKKLILEQNARIEQLQKSTESPVKQTAPATGNQTFIVQQSDDRSKRKFGQSLRKELPPEDRLDKDKIYIYVGGTKIMNVYLKDGSEVYAPYDKPIIFSMYNTEQRKTENGESRWYNYSIFTTRSKLECKFVEESPEFGFTIFTKVNDARKIDPELVGKVKEASDVVNRLNDIQLLSSAESYHIDTKNMTLDRIRYELRSFKLAEILQSEKSISQQRVQNLQHFDLHQREV